MDLISEDVLRAEAQFLITLVSRFTEASVFPIRRNVPESLRRELAAYFGKSVSKLAEFPPLPEYKPVQFHF